MVKIADPEAEKVKPAALPKKGGFWRRIFWWIIGIAVVLFIISQLL